MPPKKIWSPALWDIEPDADCWVWNDRRNKYGYGLFGHVLAHREALSRVLGRPIKPKLIVMHWCDNPPCVNPSHLREATQADNLEDMRQKGRFVPKDSQFCTEGHPYTEENTYAYRGWKACRLCRTQRTREWRARQKARDTCHD